MYSNVGASRPRTARSVCLLLFLGIVFASGASAGLLGGDGVNPDDVCIYQTDQEAQKCKDGDLAFFRPSAWGNQQSPLNAAAVYCDWSQQIVYNEAGVVCVFTRKRLHVLNESR